VTTVTIANDPRFGIKAHDVVGLSMNPPDHAGVLSVDETTPIQALGRTQRPLPMTPGHAETRTHDDKRNGTTPRRAALDGTTGTGVGRMTQPHRSADICAFLDPGADGIDPETAVHVILDTLSAPKSARVHAWRTAHPNGIVNVTPTAASWMNAVFNSLDECIAAVDGSIAHPNAHDAKPFRWSRDPGDLVVSWKRGHRRLQEMESSL